MATNCPATISSGSNPTSHFSEKSAASASASALPPPCFALLYKICKYSSTAVQQYPNSGDLEGVGEGKRNGNPGICYSSNYHHHFPETRAHFSQPSTLPSTLLPQSSSPSSPVGSRENPCPVWGKNLQVLLLGPCEWFFLRLSPLICIVRVW